MAKTIKDIEILLKAKIDDLKISGVNVFAETHDHAEGDFTKYPAACVVYTGSRGQIIDTHRNERVFSFEIRMFQEQSQAGKTKQQAHDLMRDALDAIVEAFDHDQSLGNEVETVKVVEFDADFEVKAGTFNFATLKVDCLVVVESY